MDKSLIQEAQDQIEQNMKDMVVGFIRRRLAEKMRVEDDLVRLEMEINELNTLFLRDAYNKYYNPPVYEGVGAPGLIRGKY